MPLPFLTADRGFGAAAEHSADAALSFDDHAQWRRPYRPGPWRVGAAALLLLLASFILLAAMITVLAGAVSGGISCLGFGLAVIACALRLLRVGAWVSRHGLRRVGFFRTHTVPWRKTAAVRTVQQPVRWLGLPRTVQGEALLLVQQGGEQLAPLLTDHSADFLARPEAFDRAADIIETWNAEYARR